MLFLLYASDHVSISYARSYGGSLNELKMESDKLIVVEPYSFLYFLPDREVYWYNNMSIFYVLHNKWAHTVYQLVCTN